MLSIFVQEVSRLPLDNHAWRSSISNITSETNVIRYFVPALYQLLPPSPIWGCANSVWVTVSTKGCSKRMRLLIHVHKVWTCRWVRLPGCCCSDSRCHQQQLLYPRYLSSFLVQWKQARTHHPSLLFISGITLITKCTRMCLNSQSILLSLCRGEFWLGNDHIHLLTKAKDMVLRIELEDFEGVREYAKYDQFYVANEFLRYRLSVSGYR